MDQIFERLREEAVRRITVEEDKKLFAAIGTPIHPEDIKIAQAVIAHGYADPIADWAKFTTLTNEALARAVAESSTQGRLYDLAKHDLATYGHCFILTVVPFKREFRCSKCKTAFGSIRNFSESSFSPEFGRFSGQCGNCASKVRIDITDRPNDDEPKRQICLNPPDVGITDRVVTWKIPDSLVVKVKASDPVALSILPMGVLAAIMAGNISHVTFSRSSVRHFLAAPPLSEKPVVQSASDSYRDSAKPTGSNQWLVVLTCRGTGRLVCCPNKMILPGGCRGSCETVRGYVVVDGCALKYRPVVKARKPETGARGQGIPGISERLLLRHGGRHAPFRRECHDQ